MAKPLAEPGTRKLRPGNVRSLSGIDRVVLDQAIEDRQRRLVHLPGPEYLFHTQQAHVVVRRQLQRPAETRRSPGPGPDRALGRTPSLTGAPAWLRGRAGLGPAQCLPAVHGFGVDRDHAPAVIEAQPAQGTGQLGQTLRCVRRAGHSLDRPEHDREVQVVVQPFGRSEQGSPSLRLGCRVGTKVASTKIDRVLLDHSGAGIMNEESHDRVEPYAFPVPAGEQAAPIRALSW